MNSQFTGESVPLSQEDLAELRESLEEQRRFRREQLRQIAGAPPTAVRDVLDVHEAQGSQGSQGSQNARETAALTEVQVKLAASARMVLNDVEAALERMSQGRYGACHLCARPVTLARLTVVPQARYCARCQQVREKGR